MEDSYLIAHDLGLDGALKASLFGVVDGHGGEWCAEFLQREMVQTLNAEFFAVDKTKLDVMPFSHILEDVMTNTYKTLD